MPLLELNRLTAELERGHGVEGSKRLNLHHVGDAYAPRPEPVKDETHISEYAALAVPEMIRLGAPVRLGAMTPPSPVPRGATFGLPARGFRAALSPWAQNTCRQKVI